MDSVYSDEQLTLAARLYYVDGLAQSDIARFVKVSQATVSRLLSAARQRGIVKVSVADYNPRERELERELVSKFALKSAIVIRVTNGSIPTDVRRAIAHFGAELVQKLIPAHGVVAVAGGRTMRELVLKLPGDPERRITVVQAMGSVDATVGPVDAYELGRLLARAYGGSFLTINTPAFVPDKRTRDAFLSLPQIKRVWKLLQDTTIAMVGVGSLTNSIFAGQGALSAADVKELEQAGAVGEICGRFFDANGEECKSQFADRVIGIELSRLKAVPQVVAISSGTDRSEAIAASIRGGIVKTLMIDSEGAKALLKPQSESGGSGYRRRVAGSRVVRKGSYESCPVSCP